MEDFVTRAKNMFLIEPFTQGEVKNLSDKMLEFSPEAQNIDPGMARIIVGLKTLQEKEIWSDLVDTTELYAHMSLESVRNQAIESARAENPGVNFDPKRNAPAIISRM
jgi:hypothetical protein